MSALQGESPHLQLLQREFLSDFRLKGFGFVEGTKWQKHFNKESWDQEDEYKSWEQILDVAKSEQNATAKIKVA